MQVFVKGRTQPVSLRELIAIPSHKLKVPRQEFRRHRVDARLPCLCQRMQDKIVVPHIVHGAIRDIGYHGLLVELIELEPHSEIKLEFELPLVDYRVADVQAAPPTLKQEGRRMGGGAGVHLHQRRVPCQGADVCATAGGALRRLRA